MKILIYDSNLESLEKIYTLLKKVSCSEVIIHTSSSNEEFFSFFEKNEYEKIYIDSCDNSGEEVLKLILQIKPEQQIFMINDEYDCVEGKDCLYCTSEYNRKSVIKPFDEKIIHNTIHKKTFKCEKMLQGELEVRVKILEKNFKITNPHVSLNFDKRLKEITIVPYTEDIGENLTFQFKKLKLNYNEIDEGVFKLEA